MKQINATITPESRAHFANNAAYCVGTGRMGLALHKEYLDQLAMAQNLAHFKHIRGHGLFCDDMAIYQPYPDENGVEHEGYCFSYLDRVVDEYLKLEEMDEYAAANAALIKQLELLAEVHQPSLMNVL